MQVKRDSTGEEEERRVWKDGEEAEQNWYSQTKSTDLIEEYILSIDSFHNKVLQNAL